MTETLQSVRQKIEIPFQYTAGAAITRFLLGLKQKVIVAGVCGHCGRRSVPPLSFCGRCWQPISEFVELGGQGTLASFSQLADGAGVVGLIRLQGADSLLAHRLAPGSQGLRLGSRVQPVWRPERSGSILDIEHYRVIAD